MFFTASSLLRASVFAAFCFALTSAAQTQPALKGIVQFNGANGSDPTSDLIQLPSGNFLGITLAPSFLPKAPSTIYELSSSGVVKNLYRLAADGSEGSFFGNYFPNDGLLQASDGNVYGVMNAGGPLGLGLVYRFTLPGTFQIIYNFGAADGSPLGKLVQALDGNLYGVTTSGGADQVGDIFRIGLDGSYKIVYSFSNTSQVGAEPGSGLAVHPNGLLYGTLSISPAGGGSIFQFDPASGQVKVISPGPTFGTAPPVVGRDLGLYFLSPTSLCGPSCGGSLVRYGTDGSGPVTEYNFTGQQFLGLALMQASDGSFIGAGFNAGFQVNISTQTLVSLPFPVGSDTGIVGNFVEGSSGNLIAAIPITAGYSRVGALIGYFPKLPKPEPFILGFYPASASAGNTVTVLGNYFVGTTGVSINGVSATFSVKGSGALVFEVPPGATTGLVSVFNQGGSSVSAGALTVQ